MLDLTNKPYRRFFETSLRPDAVLKPGVMIDDVEPGAEPSFDVDTRFRYPRSYLAYNRHPYPGKTQAMSMTESNRAAKAGRRSNTRSKPMGWNTTDADEIARRVARAKKEHFDIKPADGSDACFSDWFARGESGTSHRVEIRCLKKAINSCTCKDFGVNRLGTCKHIEAVLIKLGKSMRGNPAPRNFRVELYLDRRDMNVKVNFPDRMRRNTRTRSVVACFLDEAGNLRGDPLQSMAALNDRLASETAHVRRRLRTSPHLLTWLAQRQRAADQRAARRRFEHDLKRGNASLDLVKLPLFPYQQEGMMHLAFTGRALLADEMGLGKTVQAIAASELLNRLHAVKKVLVISPASLKSEWLEQIVKFSDRDALIIQGARKHRHKLYRQSAFFYLANYEQILYDGDFINNELKPDLVILDEAQRIKNWQTKTAASIKLLHSRYAFVLTGTPLENRIDEIYSITQFLDPSLFGPLFRFNREFHELDKRGSAVGYKNLDQLHERLRSVMLRRRKEDVEGELPERSINNYFVSMSDEQQEQYGDHEATVARLAHLGRRRPLKKTERERLMRALSCMRMACDTPYILDQESRVSPKLDELGKLLEELFSEPQCKIIIFSEWERMLTLLAERLSKSGTDYAWHTGSVTQKRRREEINRFKSDPLCRLFLATDSAATGLNLQVASVVVNLDLPWNPAKLEQRIARAWRKHQKRPVSVINLVSEHTIEHRMLDVLRHKTQLADEVVDGTGMITEMKISAGQGAFMQRLDELLAESVPQVSPVQRFMESVAADHADRLEYVEMHGNAILAVVDKHDGALASDMKQRLTAHYGETKPQLELLDHATFETLKRLAEAGVIQFTQQPAGRVFVAPSDTESQSRKKQRREALSRQHLAAAEERQRMSHLLADGGFVAEALAPMSDALNKVLVASAIAADIETDDPVSIGQISALQESYKLPAETTTATAILRHERDRCGEQEARSVLESVDEIIRVIKVALGQCV